MKSTLVCLELTSTNLALRKESASAAITTASFESKLIKNVLIWSNFNPLWDTAGLGCFLHANHQLQSLLHYKSKNPTLAWHCCCQRVKIAASSPPWRTFVLLKAWHLRSSWSQNTTQGGLVKKIMGWGEEKRRQVPDSLYLDSPDSSCTRTHRHPL